MELVVWLMGQSGVDESVRQAFAMYLRRYLETADKTVLFFGG